MKYTIYTDGSCKNNGYENSSGGWGYVILNDKDEIIDEGAGVLKNTTNQRMELHAAAWAISQLPNLREDDIVIIYSDSAYLINCMIHQWYVNWQKNGWRNAKKQPVANQDLWEDLIPFFENPQFEFRKVKGHAGEKWNEYVDKLAQDAAATLL